MGKPKNKLELEQGEDDDAIAAQTFLQGANTSSVKKKRKASEDVDDEQVEAKQTQDKSRKRKAESLHEEFDEKSNGKSEDNAQQPKKRIKSASKSKKTSEEGEDGDEDKKYQRLILFVGQIPFEATAQDLEKHFAEHGAGKVKVRLLTEKGTSKSRGMAFVDFESPQHLVRGLRVHRTRLMGRAINVERTVGGGGNNPARKEKLSQLREFQGTLVKKEVQNLVDEAIANSKGLLTKEDADELVVKSLCVLPREAAKQVLDEILASDIANARNKKAWILGCIKRYTARLKTGEQFLSLEEEKAGVVEKRKEKPKKVPGNVSERRPPVVGNRGGGDRSERPTSGASSSNHKSSSAASKFKRGMIGAA